MHWMETFSAKTQKLLRKTNSKNFSWIGHVILKISFLKDKNHSFWENELWTYNNKNSQNKNLIPKIKIPIRTIF